MFDGKTTKSSAYTGVSRNKAGEVYCHYCK